MEIDNKPQILFTLLNKKKENPKKIHKKGKSQKNEICVNYTHEDTCTQYSFYQWPIF